MGERLKWSRGRLGWTQRDLAASASVGLATVRRIEQQAMEPRMATTRRLATVLGVPESWLAYGVGEAPMMADTEEGHGE